jgi:hypothetical protein
LAPGAQTACNPATNTYTQEVIVTFTNAPSSGMLEVNGQQFAIGVSPQTVTLTGLVSDGNPVDVTASFTADASCSRTENDLFTAPASCQCSITDLAAGTQTACNPATNTYTQEVTVTFTNAPSSGMLEVNGQQFAIGTSPQTVTLTGLVSDGNPVDVTASFTADATCTRTENDLFTAPADCTPPPGKAFVFLANKITLKRTKQNTPAGDMHANGALTIEKGDPSTYNSNLTATGKITIQKDNTINGNVKSPLPVSNSGTVNGTITIGAVDNEPLPSDSYTAGGLNKTVPSGGSLTLAPGSYGIVTLNNGGTLKLTSGEYRMNELRYPSGAENGVIEIDLSSGDPVAIKVVSNLQFGQESAVRLLPNGENDSELVTFFTLQSTSLTLGRETYLLGNFNAPNAKVTLAKNSQLRGALCVKELIVERDCLFLHHDSPGSLPGPGNLPKAIAGEVEEVGSDQSTVISYQLEQNYPNPFNPSTTISFSLPEASEVTLSIFNTSGQLVKQVASGRLASGRYQVVWDATNERGERVASGVYVYRLKAGEFVARRKLVLMK